MSSQNPSSPQKRARRPSKFIEGPPATCQELLNQTPSSNELFFNILSEMDEFEKKRQHRGSSSSVESLVSSTGSPVKDSRKSFSERERRKSTGFGRPSLDILKEALEEKNSKFVGRLRAMTGGRDRDEKRSPYPGTWEIMELERDDGITCHEGDYGYKIEPRSTEQQGLQTKGLRQRDHLLICLEPSDGDEEGNASGDWEKTSSTSPDEIWVGMYDSMKRYERNACL